MRQLVKEKENCEFKPVKIRLKIDLVSYPAKAEVLVNMVRNKTTLIFKLHTYDKLNCLESTVLYSIACKQKIYRGGIKDVFL